MGIFEAFIVRRRIKLVLTMLQNLLESLINGELENLRSIVLVAGLIYLMKLSFKCLCNFYSALITFVVPSVWPRSFPKEYGPWAIVTGCSKGIGLCYAQELAQRGMNLILIARKAELLNKIASEIHTQYGVKVEVIIADFGKGASIYKDIEAGIAGKDIGVLVNNVGVASDGLQYFPEASEETMWNMINVNMASVTIMMKMVLPKMEARGKGAIINVASVASFGPGPFLTQYHATKAYVDFLSRGIAYEYSDKGITVQCVCPGPVRTDMLDGIFKDEVQDFGAMAPNVDVYTAQAMSTLGFS